jgi:hypothetical protein
MCDVCTSLLCFELELRRKKMKGAGGWNYISSPRQSSTGILERFLIGREMNNRLPMYFGIIIQMSYSPGEL